MHESEPPADLGTAAPRRRRLRRRGELPAEAHGDGVEAAAAGEDAPPGRGPIEVRPSLPEDAVASRSTEEEARDLVALRRAKRGDDSSFAAVLRADDAAVHAFVSALLTPGAVDSVVIDTYVKAYRGLPLAPDASPRTWLLRLAITACADEERRRTRHRLRERPDADAEAGPPEPPPVPLGMEADQRTVLALVDGAGLTVREAAKVLEAEPAGTRALLVAARTAAARTAAGAGEEAPPGTDAAPVDSPGPPPPLGIGPPRPHGPEFWNEVGEALLRARSTPAATPLPTLGDARGAPSPAPPVPAAPPHRHRGGDGRAQALRRAERAQHEPARFPWQRLALFTGVAVAAVVVVSLAAWLVGHATDRDARLGLTAAKVLDRVDRSLASDPSISVSVRTSGEGPEATATLVRSSDGSYRYWQPAPHTDEAWDASALRATRVTDAGAAGGGRPAEIVDLSGVPPGPPGLPAEAVGGVGDPLVGAVRLARGAHGSSVETTKVGDRDAWVVSGRLSRQWSPRGSSMLVGLGSTGEGRPGDVVRLTVDQSLLLPLSFELRRGGKVVRRLSFEGYAVGNPVDPGTWTAALPAEPAPGAQVATGDRGYRVVGLEQARQSDGDLAVTPGYVPDGFTLETVARHDPTAGPATPQVVLVYRRGAEQIVVTSSAPASVGADGPWGAAGAAGTRRTGIGSGRFAGQDARVGDNPLPYLWVSDAEAVVTVAGDLSRTDAVRMASSLR